MARQTGRQAGRQTDVQTDLQTGRQIHRKDFKCSIWGFASAVRGSGYRESAAHFLSVEIPTHVSLVA